MFRYSGYYALILCLEILCKKRFYFYTSTQHGKLNSIERETGSKKQTVKCKNIFWHKLRSLCKDCSSNKSFFWVKFCVGENF